MLKKIGRHTLNLSKTYWKEVIALLMLLLAYVFFRSERRELGLIVPQLERANSFWLLTGLCVTAIYIFFQTGMYVLSFKSIGASLKFLHAAEMFLKRNFLSVFLPAGGVSALAYTPSKLRKEGLNRMQSHQASGLFAFAGLLTIFIVGLPVITYSLTGTNSFKNAWWGLLVILAIIFFLVLISRSLKKKGKAYLLVEKIFPKLMPSIDELFAANVNSKSYAGVIGYSVGVECTGILHIYIAMLAMGVHPSFEASAVGYVVAVLLMVISPFMRGLGAVELSLVYILELFGYSSLEAISITVLYRLFEFWLPLALGFISFALKGKQLFVRIAPAVLIFMLGLINIISVVTPPLADRLRLTRQFIPQEAIHASNLLVLFIGLALLVASAFLIKGYRSAWWLAIIFCVISLIGNLTKALDYEEAIFATCILILLVFSASQYRVRSSLKWMRLGLISVVTVFIAVCIFGFIGFYFIDKKHFGIDFSWQESLVYSAKIFLLSADNTLHPVTRFGQEYIRLIRALGFGTWGFALFTLIRPYLSSYGNDASFQERAKYLLSQYGNSAVDYFKTYKDKLLFFSDRYDAFMAYRIANGFAIVLEEPVCAEENKVGVIREFDNHCRKMGLKLAFYRVDENSIPWFNQVRKQKIFIGQEAILQVSDFSLEGKDKKSLRNGLNSLQKKGFATAILTAPHDDLLLQSLQTISDEWLRAFAKKEQVFSQGMFEPSEIRGQDIIVVKDALGEIVAFLNIIPDFSPMECTYDLIRKKSDAPGGCMDALVVKLVEYAREKGLQYINLGLVPMTGNIQPQSPAEQVVKFAAEKMKRFRHFQTLRSFKEKYASVWQNKYIVYSNDFDLVQLPAALQKVMKP
ncbi:MAG: flippase-like domain-containing protein [Terrimonas sp.]|nr:flippase-like domain-containing protein [Terrimonas sp.]